MALCRKLTSLASCSGRIDDAFIPTFQNRHRNRRTARFFTNFVDCRAVRTPVTYGASAGFQQEREWQIRATQTEGSAKFQRFYATCEKGLEEILAAELSSPLISASEIELGLGGVSFVGTQATGYNANLWLRTGDRVLCELARGILPKGGSGVYDFVRAAADWPLLLDDDATPQISQSDQYRAHWRVWIGYKNQTLLGSKFSYSTYYYLLQSFKVGGCRPLLKGTPFPFNDLWPSNNLAKSCLDPRVLDEMSCCLEDGITSLTGLVSSTLCTVNRYKFRKFAVQTRLLNFDENQASVTASLSNAIWDSLRDGCGPKWPECEDAVSVPLFLHVDRDLAVLYRDMSGISLYKRGYGDTMVQSKEGLAAAVLTIAGWNHLVPGFGEANKNAAEGKDRVLLDPFCGTGTFLIQAALMASNGAPGLMRRQWPFQSWHDYDQRAWAECRDAAASMQVSSLSGARLIGNDMNDGAIAKCKNFARAAGVLPLLDLSCETSRHYRPPCSPSLVVTNPPCSAPLTYSSLRGEDERLLTLWQGFGQFLKSQCRGADVYVLSENDWLTDAMHMVPDRKWEMQPDKQWRGKRTDRRTEKIFGPQERKLLHYHVQSRRPQGDPLSVIPFSSMSPKSSRL